jgi:hypothetical protein
MILVKASFSLERVMTTETLADCCKLRNLYKGLVVNPCHSPRKCLRALQTWASRETRVVDKVYNLCTVKVIYQPCSRLRAAWILT